MRKSRVGECRMLIPMGKIVETPDVFARRWLGLSPDNAFGATSSQMQANELNGEFIHVPSFRMVGLQDVFGVSR